MDTNQVDEGKQVNTANRRITRRREFRYSCGCTTTQIESSPRPIAEPPGCSGHGGALLMVVETTEVHR
jgi:hypothetical protein